jgi:eukaryotic-like serine/threonine-protein kinase
MSTLSPDRWDAVSPYFDRALELSSAEREALLATLRLQNPALAADLLALLEEHQALARESFLDQPPVLAPGPSAQEGQIIGAYALVSPIGQGGMGTVWLARRSDGRFERRVAVKFPAITLLGAGLAERFRREGTILGRLAHPHIADLVDAGVSPDGRPYLVLEYVDGDPIDRYCDQKALSVEARVDLFLDVLAAVAHAHANLIVHRDLKPSNVLVTAGGEVKLLDFGIAKLLEGDATGGARAQLTGEGGGLMTPEFATPEQVTGGPITVATDVHALGTLLFLLLTGEHPLGPGSIAQARMIKAIVETEPPAPSHVVVSAGAGRDTAATRRSTTPERLRRALLGDLDTIVAKALKKEPRERYASVTALADDLRRYLRHEPIDARPDTLAYRAGRFVRRNRVAVGLATLSLAASVAGVVATLLQARTASAQRDIAFAQVMRADAINDLSSFLLSDAAPSGKPFTVNELLARAEKIVSAETGATGANRVELLVSIGRQYTGQDQDEPARRVLEEAYRLSRDIEVPSTRAKAACALANALSRGEGLPRAMPLVEAGLAALPDEPIYALERVDCLLSASAVARNAGRSEEAIARALEARRVLQASPFDSRPVELSVLMELGEDYREAGRSVDALAVFQESSRLLTSMGRGETQTAGTLLNDWALAIDGMGRPFEAEKIFRRAIAISRANQGEDAVSPMLLLNYGRVLDNLDRIDEALDYCARAWSSAGKAQDEVVVNQSLLMLAWIDRRQGRFDRATQRLSEVEGRLQKVLPPGHIAFAAVTGQRALLAQDRGDYLKALALADEGVSILETSIKSGGLGALNLPTALARRADIKLDLHRYQEAETDAALAIEKMRPLHEPGALSTSRGRAHVRLGRALLAQGRTDEARGHDLRHDVPAGDANQPEQGAQCPPSGVRPRFGLR